MNLAPIALFVYNRPEHTRKTLEALRGNVLSDQSDLFVFCDGPKSESDFEKVRKVRKTVHGMTGFRNIEIIVWKENAGLAQSIVSGVSEIVNQYGHVIVLEDDVITSKYFLKYMNDALDLYRDFDKVMHISGYMFPVDSSGIPETFFYRSTSCWGWGTWARAWKHFEKDPNKLLNGFSADDRNRFCLNGATDHWRQVLENVKGRIDTWAVFWYASVFQQKGLCLHPAKSLTENIGHDDSGTNCNIGNAFNVKLNHDSVSTFPDVIVENELVVDRLQTWYIERQGSYLRKLARKVKYYFLLR